MIKDKAVIVFEGDSVTDAGRKKDNDIANQNIGNGYAMMAAAEMLRRYPEKELEFHNRGNSGDRISNQFPRWRLDCLNLKPDYVSICVAFNDSLGKITHQNGENPDEFIFLYKSLLQWTRLVLPDVKFIICQPYGFLCEKVEALTPDVIDEIREIGDRLKIVAEEFDAVYVPFFDVLEEKIMEYGREYYLRDAVHPTPAGHALLANTWLEAVLGNEK